MQSAMSYPDVSTVFCIGTEKYLLSIKTEQESGLGAKSQILSSVAPRRKENSIAILRLVCIYSAWNWKSMFY